MNNLRLLDPVFGDSLEHAMRRFLSPGTFELDPAPLRMRIDVTESDQGYSVKADIPGVKKEDIHVKVDGNTVSIDAQTSSEKETRGNGDKVLRSERHYGAISRAFSLGHEVDEAKVEAKYADGVLSLDLPKKTSAPASKIVVQ